MFVSTILPFLVYWLILFVACYILVEYGQNYLYDEVTPGMWWKVAVGSLIFAVLLTWRRTSFESLFMTDLPMSALQAIVWFAVFTLLFRFHPPHALAISLVAFLLVSGASTLVINSMTGMQPGGPSPVARTPSKPIRRSLGPALPSDPKAAVEPAPGASPAG